MEPEVLEHPQEARGGCGAMRWKEEVPTNEMSRSDDTLDVGGNALESASDIMVRARSALFGMQGLKSRDGPVVDDGFRSG